MALKPEPMQRALIVASKGQQPAVIEALHGLRAAHFIDFQESRDGEFSDFKIGAPLPQGAGASERLVRVRALLRHLGVEGQVPARTFSPREIDARLDGALDQIEADVTRAVESREHLRASLAEGREMEAKLAPLTSLPLKLEDYAGYETLAVFPGRADPAYEAELARAAPEHLLVKGEGTLFALFVPKARSAEASDLLYRHGFAEVEVPEGKGLPGERIKEIVAERATLEQRLAKADQDLARLAGEHRDFLLATEEHLAIAVEKAEAPLAFASTENAFVVDAWIPMGAVSQVESAVTKATNGNVHFQRLETSADVHEDHHHGHDDSHGGADAAYAAHPKAPAPVVLPPTKHNNGSATAPFEWFTSLFSTPRYNEIDPTVVFAIFFPLFFGFMIGDLGLGLLMIGLGALMMAKLKRVEGMPSLGRAIVIAGVVAALLGGLVFKDALGIPLGVTAHMEEVLEEAGIAAPTCRDLYATVNEPTWSCLVRGSGAAVHPEGWAEPIVNKVSDLNTMLLLSVLAAFVHLLIGLLFGIRNELGHGAKHVAAKLGYLLLLVTFFPAVTALLRPDMFVGGELAGESKAALTFHLPMTATQAYLGAGVGFLVGAIVLGWAEGFGGVLEIPSMFSAIMSYLRLGAVAIAKGAMAIAFNNLTLVAALTGGGIVLVLGILGFLVAQMVLFVLGLLSGGIQALRLNFVEFFTKFYKGGGTPYKPFGRARQHTAAGPAPAATLVTITGLDRQP